MFFFNSSIRVCDSGLLQGYKDYHSHLLPGVDDGVQKFTVTKELLNLMQEHGVKEILFTPHVMEDMPNTPEQLRELFNSLDLSGFNIKISLSAENMLDNFFSLDRANQLPLMEESILVETSYFTPPYNLHGILDNIMSTGIYPVLAHPCRYEYMDEKDYDKLCEKRIRFQLNLPALGGLYGTRVQKKAMWLLSHGYYDITGTDTHSLKQYKLFLDSKLSRKCVKQLEELISK